MNLLFKKTFKVPIFDASPRGEIRADTLMNYLQETASKHAEQTTIAISELLAQGKTWVLSRYHLQILRPPKFWEEIEVTTWPSGLHKRFATRDFEVVSVATGETLALASTSWAALDFNLRKLISPSEIVPPGYALDKRAIDDSFPSIAKIEKTPAYEKTLPVMIRDIDINNHVNNTVYVGWAIEAIPLTILKNHRLQSIEASYHAEAKYGDHIISYADQTENQTTYLHKIVNGETGAELTRLKTTWTTIL